MKELIIFPVSNYSGCMQDDELKSNFPELYPKVGDVLMGEVQSEKEFGYFIKIAGQGHNQRCSLSGLLHKSNINKHSPWSISNKKIGYDDYHLIDRKVLVEVISITEKGISLRELDYFKDITIDKILNANDLEKISMSKTILIEPFFEDYWGEVFGVKEKISTDFLYKSQRYGAFVFKNILYVYMYFNGGYHYFTKDLTKSMTLNRDSKGYELCNHEDYTNHKKDKNYDKIWESDESISEQNNEHLHKYNRILKNEDDKQNKKLLEEKLEQIGPLTRMNFYVAYKEDAFFRGLNEDDQYNRKRYEDGEEKFLIEVYRNPDNDEIFIKYKNNFFKNGDYYTIYNDECLIYYEPRGNWKGYNGMIMFKDSVKSDLLFDKYKSIFDKLESKKIESFLEKQY